MAGLVLQDQQNDIKEATTIPELRDINVKVKTLNIIPHSFQQASDLSCSPTTRRKKDQTQLQDITVAVACGKMV